MAVVDKLKTTPLTPIHVNLGARMMEFAGYTMPLSYQGIVEEHRAVRRSAGLFDISHMGKLSVAGEGAQAFLQNLLTNDVSRCRPGQTLYTMMCREDGGVIDDLIISQLTETHYFIIVNASRKQEGLAWFHAHAPGDVVVRDETDELCGLALQGPKSPHILQRVLNIGVEEISRKGVVWVRAGEHGGVLSRTGYTGEEGFELFFSVETAPALWDHLMAVGEEEGLVPCGLGARDTLRLEMGYSLYGHELSETVSPWEAILAWTVKLDKGPFIGREALVEQKRQGVRRRVVGLMMRQPGPIPRHGCEVRSQGARIGEVTSGSFAPSLNQAVALAMLDKSFLGIGTEVEVVVHGRGIPAVVTEPPFYRRTQ